MKNFVFGVKIDSKTCQICVKDLSKKTLLNQKIHILGLTTLIENNLIKAFPPQETLVVMDSVGESYYLFPKHIFEKFDYEVRIENPWFISKFAENLSVSSKKTDKYDAEVLALYGIEKCLNSYKVSYFPNDLKSTVRHWAKLRKVKQEVEGHAFSQALVVFPLIDEVFGGSPLKSKIGRMILKKFSGLHEIASFSYNELVEFLGEQIKRGKGKTKLAQKLLEYAKLINKSEYIPSEKSVKLLKLALEELEKLEAFLSWMEDHLINIGNSIEEVLLLRTIPGIGPLSSVVLYAEIGNIERFKNRDSLWAYFGMNPRNQKNDETIQKSSGISRAGIGYVRGILYMIAFSLIRKGGPYYETYWELRKKGKSHKEALIIIAHKIVRIIYSVLKKKEPCKKFANYKYKEFADFEKIEYNVSE
ncbi:MAG: transposase [Brevinematia bacterium]